MNLSKLRIERLPAPGRGATCVATLMVCLLLNACASIPDASTPATPVEPLQRATIELPPADVLDVSIVQFDANVPIDPEVAEVEQVFADVRRAEARYVPFTLRQTLQRSGQWGDVRVVPTSRAGGELEITGRIVDSHGQILSLDIQAHDASGRVWLDRTYAESINEARYRLSAGTNEDPFQSLYNRIANDLVQRRAELGSVAMLEIAEVAELRFSAELAPSFYRQRLNDSGNGRITARPSDQPDLLAGPIDQARMRDARMIDILDQHYNDFHGRMLVPYSDWREASYREMRNLQTLRRQANTRKAIGALALLGGLFGVIEADSDLGQLASQAAIIGGIYAISSGIDKGRQTSIHVESLRELGRSLEEDLAPQVLEIQDKTVRLTGSAEDQYRQWREILTEMVAEQQRLMEADAAQRDAATYDAR
ncbi:MAG: hypothetical protein ABR550_02050 [Wenzhouxiangellaceae bacterium]